MTNRGKKAVGKGGNEVYIKKGAKSRADGKRSIDDRAEPSVIRRYQITAYTDGLLSQLALVSGSSKGEALELAVQLYGFAYSQAVRLMDARPETETLFSVLARLFSTEEI